MSKFLGFLFFLLAFTSSNAATPAVKKAHAAVHRISQSVLLKSSQCSATAIGRAALLTATHCEVPSDVLSITGGDSVNIVGRIRDGFDHTIYLLDAAVFDDFVDVRLGAALESSDRIFIFGNPGELFDIYREGYVAGYEVPGGLAALFGGAPTAVLFDFQGFFGDSGSGVFDQDGNVVDVVSIVQHQNGEADKAQVHIQFMGGYRLAFTAADLEKARKHAPAPKP